MVWHVDLRTLFDHERDRYLRGLWLICCVAVVSSVSRTYAECVNQSTTTTPLETVKKSLHHSCGSELTHQGISLHLRAAVIVTVAVY